MSQPNELPTIADNEEIYDEQIAPLMAQILDICKAHSIPMVAAFEYAPEDLCASFILPKGAAEQLERAARIVSPGPSLMAFTITHAAPEGPKS